MSTPTQNEVSTPENVHPKGAKMSTPEDPKYQNVRPIIKALADPIKRKKLEAISQSLKAHNVLRNTYCGCGDDPVPMEEVGELLECLSAVKQG